MTTKVASRGERPKIRRRVDPTPAASGREAEAPAAEDRRGPADGTRREMRVVAAADVEAVRTGLDDARLALLAAMGC